MGPPSSVYDKARFFNPALDNKLSANDVVDLICDLNDDIVEAIDKSVMEERDIPQVLHAIDEFRRNELINAIQRAVSRASIIHTLPLQPANLRIVLKEMMAT